MRRAVELYNVPRSTLGDRISGHVQPGAISGPPTYVTSTEEELASFLCCRETIGYAWSKAEVMALVERVLECRGRQLHITHGWWASFSS